MKETMDSSPSEPYPMPRRESAMQSVKFITAVMRNAAATMYITALRSADGFEIASAIITIPRTMFRTVFTAARVFTNDGKYERKRRSEMIDLTPSKTI